MLLVQYELVIFVVVSAIVAGFPITFLASVYGWTKAFFFLNFGLLASFFGVIIGKDLDQNFLPKAAKGNFSQI